MGACHRRETRGTVQPDREVAAIGQSLEVTPRPAAQIEQRERRLALDILQQGCDILADVMAARAFPEILRAIVILVQRKVDDLLQFLRSQFHIVRRTPLSIYRYFLGFPQNWIL